MKTVIFALLLGLTSTLGLNSALAAGSHSKGAKPMTVRMTTNHGDIVIELDADKAPQTVANFLSYVKSGFFNGTIFHRVIPGFMIQGGGFEPGMKQKPTQAPIKNEADNGLQNLEGTIAMARTNDPQSATAQFFINVKNNGFLNHSAPTAQGWGYCVFGKVTQGLDIVHAIEKVPTTTRMGMQDVPAQDVVIETVVVIE
jgi:peptidyl-prolyl cis-trans isomerase B (cyclophilin B)